MAGGRGSTESASHGLRGRPPATQGPAADTAGADDEGDVFGFGPVRSHRDGGRPSPVGVANRGAPSSSPPSSRGVVHRERWRRVFGDKVELGKITLNANGRDLGRRPTAKLEVTPPSGGKLEPAIAQIVLVALWWAAMAKALKDLSDPSAAPNWSLGNSEESTAGESSVDISVVRDICPRVIVLASRCETPVSGHLVTQRATGAFVQSRAVFARGTNRDIECVAVGQFGEGASSAGTKGPWITVDNEDNAYVQRVASAACVFPSAQQLHDGWNGADKQAFRCTVAGAIMTCALSEAASCVPGVAQIMQARQRAQHWLVAQVSSGPFLDEAGCAFVCQLGAEVDSAMEAIGAVGWPGSQSILPVANGAPDTTQRGTVDDVLQDISALVDAFAVGDAPVAVVPALCTMATHRLSTADIDDLYGFVDSSPPPLRALLVDGFGCRVFEAGDVIALPVQHAVDASTGDYCCTFPQRAPLLPPQIAEDIYLSGPAHCQRAVHVGISLEYPGFPVMAPGEHPSVPNVNILPPWHRVTVDAPKGLKASAQGTAALEFKPPALADLPLMRDMQVFDSQYPPRDMQVNSLGGGRWDVGAELLDTTRGPQGE